MSVTPQQIVQKYFKDAASVGNDGKLSVKDPAKVAAQSETLARASAFGSPDERSQARWLIWETALALGIVPASINDLYMARGQRIDCQAVHRSRDEPARDGVRFRPRGFPRGQAALGRPADF